MPVLAAKEIVFVVEREHAGVAGVACERTVFGAEPDGRQKAEGRQQGQEDRETVAGIHVFADA
ncbi:MAG: hypothetical protein WDM96_10790 [Lacunisphaera sp.]